MNLMPNLGWWETTNVDRRSLIIFKGVSGKTLMVLALPKKGLSQLDWLNIMLLWSTSFQCFSFFYYHLFSHGYSTLNTKATFCIISADRWVFHCASLHCFLFFILTKVHIYVVKCIWGFHCLTSLWFLQQDKDDICFPGQVHGCFCQWKELM